MINPTEQQERREFEEILIRNGYDITDFTITFKDDYVTIHRISTGVNKTYPRRGRIQ